VPGLTSDALRPTLNEPSPTSQLVLDAFKQLCEADPAPVYLQIERCIRLLVAEGVLRPGQRLPSVRALAEQLGLAANTVARAYTALAGDGIIDSRAGAGSVVADRLPASAAEPDQPGRERLQRVARKLVAYSLALGHAPGEVIHAVRAELAAFGRAEGSPAAPDFEVRPRLPAHPVPPPVRAAVGHDRLEVSGLVARAASLCHADLAPLGRTTLQQPFACDEGWVVPSLRWTGVRLAEVLALAEPLAAARFVRVRAGAYAMPLSLAEVSEALLADELDGEPLALEHGAPWRLVVPGGACHTSVKWVDRLEVVAQANLAAGSVS
jgi:GntR family transcriptional regulator